MHPLLVAGVVAGAAAVGEAIANAMNARERRAAIHRAFLAFNDSIKHEQFEERELLRERRELLTERLRTALPHEHKARLFTQGSYAMQTGVKPLTGEYDIDVGLEFECSTKNFDSPVHAKMLVRDALRQGRREVEIRRSCVTVFYKGADGLPDHHVDIAVYARGKEGQLMLAKGRRTSGPADCFWELSHPEQLTAMVRDRFEGDQVAQFRRCVRYLKRWKQYNFRSPAPYSIALTVATYHWFRPNADQFLETLDDRTALLHLVHAMVNEFCDGRLQVTLPVAPQTDLLQPMTLAQMTELEGKLRRLAQTLEAAGDQDVHIAIAALAAEFGADFQ